MQIETGREVINVLTQRAASQACSKQLANVRIVEIFSVSAYIQVAAHSSQCMMAIGRDLL